MERLTDCRDIKVGMHLMFIDKKTIAIDTIKKLNDTTRKPSKTIIEYRADFHTCSLTEHYVRYEEDSDLDIDIRSKEIHSYILTEQEYKDKIDMLMRIKHIKEMCDTSINGLIETIKPPKEEDDARA